MFKIGDKVRFSRVVIVDGVDPWDFQDVPVGVGTVLEKSWPDSAFERVQWINYSEPALMYPEELELVTE